MEGWETEGRCGDGGGGAGRHGFKTDALPTLM